MEVKQVYQLVNDATSEVLGKTGILKEDLSNVVDVGDEVFNANAMDKYVKSLINHIGRVIFVNRPYRGYAPSVLMDGWEFGSVLEKIRAKLPEATENETWELEDGASYDPNIFYSPKVSVKFFNKLVTFQIPMSFTEKQVKQSFSNAMQLNSFLSMLYTAVDKGMTVKIDALIMRTINNMTGETLYSEYPAGNYGASSGVRAVNLLYLYNQTFGTNLTKAQAITTPEFIRFASLEMKKYVQRLASMSTIFNVGGVDTFTPAEMLHIVLHADFESAAKVYLYDAQGQFNTDNLKLPKADTVPYWQGSGEKFAFEDTSKIDITTSEAHTIEISGVLGVMFDRDALGVCNMDRRVTSNYNPTAEFFTNWYKYDAGYFNDLNENFVVFFIADAA